MLTSKKPHSGVKPPLYITTLLTALMLLMPTGAATAHDRDNRHDDDRPQTSDRFDRYENGRYAYSGYCRDGFVWNEYRNGVYYGSRCVGSQDRQRPQYYHSSTRKPYRIGYSLPEYVEYRPIPRETLRYLRAAPRGYSYVRVGSDILLINNRSNVVKEIIPLSASRW